MNRLRCGTEYCRRCREYSFPPHCRDQSAGQPEPPFDPQPRISETTPASLAQHTERKCDRSLHSTRLPVRYAKNGRWPARFDRADATNSETILRDRAGWTVLEPPSRERWLTCRRGQGMLHARTQASYAAARAEQTAQFPKHGRRALKTSTDQTSGSGRQPRCAHKTQEDSCNSLVARADSYRRSLPSPDAGRKTHGRRDRADARKESPSSRLLQAPIRQRGRLSRRRLQRLAGVVSKTASLCDSLQKS